MNAPADLPLLVIVGPTASGKSALGVWLAERLGGEVIACDSTQLHRGFDIGTAKPTNDERRGVPHHLLDVLDGKDESTAGGYRERVIEVLNDLRARRKIPVLTVGTGLYLRALLEGLAEVPQRSDGLRERLWAAASEHGPGHLHRMLRRLDPESAEKIMPADEQKLIRAIEVCLLTKKPLSEVHRSGRKPLQGWHAVKIGLMPPREELYERVHARTDAMFARGWMEEVRGLDRQRSARGREGVRFYWLPRTAQSAARRNDARRGARRDPASDAALCEKADDVVPARKGSALAGGIWR